jgi:3-deoxy-7-phosphoheptulonate synthase
MVVGGFLAGKRQVADEESKRAARREPRMSDVREPRQSDAHDLVFLCDEVHNVNIDRIRPIISPAVLSDELPASAAVYETVREGRAAVRKLVHGEDDRLMVVVGPCSVHDPAAALDYARRLVKLASKLSADLKIVMRVYFEKPRTTIGWKGLINDPDLDGTHNIKKGIRLARQILLDINEQGLPCGCEFLDTISPQYLADLVTWGAIGARTTESQVHRELTSGLSMPVGFKNGTSGDCQIAADAIKASEFAHSFLSVTSQGTVAIVNTNGNAHCHLILRGGSKGTNYDGESVAAAVRMLEKAQVNAKVVVDCSHGNSNKLHTNQSKVAEDVAAQLAQGSTKIFGVMIESNIEEGNQPEPLKNPGKPLKYGQSITDACIHWADTETVLHKLAQVLPHLKPLFSSFFS